MGRKNMSDLCKLQDQFKTNLGQLFQAIQTFREVDLTLFHRIAREAEELARILEGQPLVPKSLLNELRTAVKILRAEAPYIKGENNQLIAMANRLEVTFDLILKGECHEDRVPGVPRII